MKVLVIGSKGFVGSHVRTHFKNIGHAVWGCDVAVEYNDPNYFLVDSTNASYDDIFLATQFEVCINCSGAASVPDSFANPLRDYTLNVVNVYKALEAIRKYQPACKFINLSSAAVYGNPDSLPVKESSAIHPLSPYGSHKMFAEQACTEFYRYFNIQTCSARIFSAYGPGLQKQLFWDWFQKANNSSDIGLHGTGGESRDFIFIDDLVNALHCIAQKAEFKGEVVNVANGKEVFIKDAINVFKNALSKPFSYSFNNEVRKGDPVNWKGDIGLLRSFGYQQQVSFEEGIIKYVQWLRERR